MKTLGPHKFSILFRNASRSLLYSGVGALVGVVRRAHFLIGSVYTGGLRLYTTFTRHLVLYTLSDLLPIKNALFTHAQSGDEPPGDSHYRSRAFVTFVYVVADPDRFPRFPLELLCLLINNSLPAISRSLVVRLYFYMDAIWTWGTHSAGAVTAVPGHS